MVMLTNGREAAVRYIDSDNFDVEDKDIPTGMIEKIKDDNGHYVGWSQEHEGLMNEVVKKSLETENIPPSFQVKRPHKANIEKLKDEEVEVIKRRGEVLWESD